MPVLAAWAWMAMALSGAMGPTLPGTSRAEESAVAVALEVEETRLPPSGAVLARIASRGRLASAEAPGRLGGLEWEP